MGNFLHLRQTALRLLNQPELSGSLYLAGGVLPWILSGEDSQRDHGDLDLVVEAGDLPAVRRYLCAAGYYRPELDSRSLPCNRKQEDYGLDWEALERAAANPRNRVMLLTNPHNPTGKVYTRDELGRIHAICHAHGITVISDDIHRDVVYEPARYVPILDVSTEGTLIACSSSKTFNTPGLIGSYCIIPDPILRERFLFELKQKNALSSVSILGMEAQICAYNRCESYVHDLVAHVRGNMEYLAEYVEKNLPGMYFSMPQGTYLAWIDVSGLGLTASELQDRLVNRGHVGIMSGVAYGDADYVRMNVACPRSKLEDGLERVRAALVE